MTHLFRFFLWIILFQLPPSNYLCLFKITYKFKNISKIYAVGVTIHFFYFSSFTVVFFLWNMNAWLWFMTTTFPSAFFFVWLFILFLFGVILFLFHTSSNYKLHKPLLQTWSDTTKYYFQEMRVEQGRQIGKNTGKIRIRHRQSSLSYTPNVFFLNKFSTW